MFYCNVCSREFNSKPSLNAHQVSHKNGNRYLVSRKKNTKKYNCLNCNILFEHKNSTNNKYCSNNCFQEYNKRIKYEKILDGSIESFSSIKAFLLDTKGICSECGVGQIYNNKPLSLHCDHIDGDSDNNKLNNLRLLCPNCHSQTETFCGRNKKNTKRNNYLRKYKAKYNMDA